MDCFKHFPKELLTNIFKYLPNEYLHPFLLRYMLKEEKNEFFLF